MVLLPPPVTLITETDSETESNRKPAHSTANKTTNKRKHSLPVKSLIKLDSSPRQKQCIIDDYYGPDSWYNTPVPKNRFASLTIQEIDILSNALNDETPSTMSIAPLHNDEYLELQASLQTNTSLEISALSINIADTLLDQERMNKGTAEPKAKRSKTTILHRTIYDEIARKIETLTAKPCAFLLVVLIDKALQHHRSEKAPVITYVIDHEEDKPLGKPEVEVKDENVIPPSPMPKRTGPTSIFSAPKPLETDQKPPAQAHTYAWNQLPLTPQNKHIHGNSFLKTIPTVFHFASAAMQLTCTYNENPQATLVAALHLLGTALPAETLTAMFKTNFTSSDKTIDSLFKEHQVNSHFSFTDYATACADKNLDPGYNTLFRGHSGPNFGGDKGFSNTYPILCQMEIEAPKAVNQKRTYQWTLFFPHMNTIVTCHDFPTKTKVLQHAWVLGRETIDYLKETNNARSDRRLAKLIFPHKSDNATDLKLISAVFLTANSKDIQL